MTLPSIFPIWKSEQIGGVDTMEESSSSSSPPSHYSSKRVATVATADDGGGNLGTADESFSSGGVLQNAPTPPSAATKKSKYSTEVTCPRLFLKGIRLPQELNNDDQHSSRRQQQLLLEQAIRQTFGRFGGVSEVFISEKKAFAMVTMATTEQASQAYEACRRQDHPQDLFQEIRPAQDHMPMSSSPPPPTLNKQQRRHLQQLEQLQELAMSANWILQCTKSHVERLVDYLQQAHHQHGQEILGHCTFQSSCLVFCRTANAHQASEWLQAIWYIQSCLQRSFVLNDNTTNIPKLPLLVRTTTAANNNLPDPSILIDKVIVPFHRHHYHYCHDEKMQIRLNTFPRNLQTPLLQALEEYETKNGSSSSSSFSNFVFLPWQDTCTHRLSVLRLLTAPKYSNSNNNTTLESLYWIGMEACHRPQATTSGSSSSSFDTGQESSIQSPPIHNGLSATNKDLVKDDDTSDACCRAYWKLQEALERYQQQLQDKNWKMDYSHYFPQPRQVTTATEVTNSTVNKQYYSGIDVGAAPGGWTQFLVQECKCTTVYSIDPGALDPRILALTANGNSAASKERGDSDPTEQGIVVSKIATTTTEADPPQANTMPTKQSTSCVQHIPLTFQNGLPEIAKRRQCQHQTPLQNNEDIAVDWYVSDMCVKNLPGQIDALYLAVELGLVAPHKTFVILTLKCTRGYSKATFDHLVAEQLNRIQDHMKHLQVLHLFANRQSERTIMGFWK